MEPDAEGAASRVADGLREQIVAGELLPGQRLSEERVRTAYGVSRSTLREAFQRLIRDRLLVHELSRGVFVRRLSRDDVSDLYEVRRVIECSVLQRLHVITPEGLRRVAAAMEDGRGAAGRSDWGGVAAANIRFHEALVALARSDRLDALMRGILAEYRLAYAQMPDPHVFHLAFLNRNAEIGDALRSGDLTGAADLLDSYLHDAETALADLEFA